MDEFRNVGIIGRLNSAKVIETIKRLRSFLAAEGINIILEEKIASVMMGHGLQICSPKMMGEICDLVIFERANGKSNRVYHHLSTILPKCESMDHICHKQDEKERWKIV